MVAWQMIGFPGAYASYYDLVDQHGIKIDRRKVHLEEPIRNVGTYMVVVEVADGVTAAVKTMVVAA